MGIPTIDGIRAQLLALRDDLEKQLADVNRMLGPIKAKPKTTDEFVCTICTPHRKFTNAGGLGSHLYSRHGIEGKGKDARLNRERKAREQQQQQQKGGESVATGPTPGSVGQPHRET